MNSHTMCSCRLSEVLCLVIADASLWTVHEHPIVDVEYAGISHSFAPMRKNNFVSTKKTFCANLWDAHVFFWRSLLTSILWLFRRGDSSDMSSAQHTSAASSSRRNIFRSFSHCTSSLMMSQCLVRYKCDHTNWWYARWISWTIVNITAEEGGGADVEEIFFSRIESSGSSTSINRAYAIQVHPEWNLQEAHWNLNLFNGRSTGWRVGRTSN